MSTPVTDIPNVGPATAAAFARAGITSAEQIRAMGPDEAYRQMLLAGTVPHFIWYYVLVMGLQGRPWNDAQGDEKKALRLRFDAIKASVGKASVGKAGGTQKGRSELETALSFFGVVERR